MLPPGHIAAGYLAAYSLLKFVRPELDPSQINYLLLLGAFFGFAPDLDSFRTFAREKSFTVRDLKKNDHREYFSHAPVVWLIAGLLVYFSAHDPFWKLAGLVIWLSSWSHFVLDTIEHGIMWLWPFSKRKIVIIKSQLDNITTPGFFSFWLTFVKRYITRPSFYLEIIIILIALIIYLK